MQKLISKVCYFALFIVLTTSGCGDQRSQEQAEAAYAEAKRLAETGSYIKAIAACQQALAVDQNHLETLLLAGSILQKQGNFELAIRHVAQAVQLYPDNVEARIALGDLYMRKRQNHLSASAYEAAISLAPDRLSPYRKLAIVLCDQGRYDDAVAALSKAVQLEPENAATHYNLGAVYEQLAHADSAIAAYEQTVALDSSYVDAHYHLGQIYTKLGYLEEAEVCFRTVLRHDPRYARAYTLLGQVLLQQGRTAEAETALRKALAADPFEKEAYHRLGTLYLRQARTEEGQKLLSAFQRLRKASDDINRYRYILTLYPEDADARYNLGVLYAGLGHFPAAAAEYQQTLAINPRGPERPQQPSQYLFPARKNSCGDRPIREDPRAQLPLCPSLLQPRERLHGHGRCAAGDPGFPENHQNRAQSRRCALQLGHDLPRARPEGRGRGGTGDIPASDRMISKVLE